MPIYRLRDKAPTLSETVWIAPNAIIIGSVHLGNHVSIWWNAVLRGDNDPIRIGDNTNIQDASILHTDEGAPLDIGNNVTVGHRAMLHGCTIGDGALIGIGAIILNHARIADRCLVGAGALVPEGKTFPERSLILGAPAKAVRELTDDEIAAIAAGNRHYIDNAARYRESLCAYEEIT